MRAALSRARSLAHDALPTAPPPPPAPGPREASVGAPPPLPWPDGSISSDRASDGPGPAPAGTTAGCIRPPERVVRSPPPCCELRERKVKAAKVATSVEYTC